MIKSKLKPGKKYLQKRKTIIDGIPRESEKWLKCKEITPDGAIFTRDFEPDIFLDNKGIQEELKNV